MSRTAYLVLAMMAGLTASTIPAHAATTSDGSSATGGADRPAARWNMDARSKGDAERPVWGSPGLVARIAPGGSQPLQVWDVAKSWRSSGKGKRPEYDPNLRSAWVTLEAKTVATADMTAPDWFGSTAIRSTPQWSPDGTKIAYVATTGYTGNAYTIVGAQPSPPYVITKNVRRTTAVFVYDLLSKRSTQVSFPIPGLATCGGRFAAICGAESDPMTGHKFSDTNPFWTADGTSIVFIRYGEVAPDDSYIGAKGYNVWKVAATGGEGTQLTSLDGTWVVRDTGEAIPATNAAVIRLSDPSGKEERLQRIDLRTGALGDVFVQTTFCTGCLDNQSIGDFDVSPLGTELTFSLVVLNDPTSGSIETVPLTGAGKSEMIFGWPGTFVRYSPTGSGLLKSGCINEGRKLCGIVEHFRPWRGGNSGDYDRFAEEKDRLIFAHSSLAEEVTKQRPQRTEIDIQSQQIPVIFIPGFAGSEIQCGNSVIWGSAWNVRFALDEIALNTRGVPTCPGSSSTTVLKSMAGAEVYAPTVRFMSKLPHGVGKSFAWDWRRRPAMSLQALDRAITRYLATPQARAQGQSRVVLYGHSYGGMLARSYLERDPQRIARVLTAGTPYFGSAKPLIPLLTGREAVDGTSLFGVPLPIDTELDILLSDRAFASLVRNLEGMYQLYPSANLGDNWLHVGGRGLSEQQRREFIAEHGGNITMLAAAQREHEQVWDLFWDANGVIEYRAVGGAGLATTSRLELLLSGGDVRTTLVHGNGDGTVLLNSQLQRGGRYDRRRAKVHTQVVCGVPHMKLSGTPAVTGTYAEFLTNGTVPPRINSRSCQQSTFPTKTVKLPLRSLGR
jgi:pimeloyl-ACP methyl ester carboxylesterase